MIKEPALGGIKGIERLNILTDFKNFLFDSNSNATNKLGKKNFLLLLIFEFIIVAIISTLIIMLGIQNLDYRSVDLGSTAILIIFNAVILAPVAEEFIFRYHQKLSIQRLIISFTFALAIFYSSLWRLVVFGLYIVGWSLLFKFKVPVSRRLIVFSSALLFALFHLAHFNDIAVFPTYIFVAVLILPQFFTALILSFIFWNYGLVYSICFHMAWNLLVILPKLLILMFLQV